MSALERAEQYLTIPLRYGAELGGLWWSSRRDAIERRDGTTLAVADEIRAVLDGALAHPAAPAFAFVLNVLHLMKTGGEQGFDPLSVAYASTRGVTARGRNVGLLIAELCRDLPWVPGTIKAEDVAVALRSLRLYGSLHAAYVSESAEPPRTRADFEAHLARRLAHYDSATLVHWLTHGCAPGGGGKKLAEEAESLPDRLARILGIARRRVRLAGAASLVPALDAALTLPPRGRPPEALPIGGYCDVTTRGAPEQLLTGQFALDPDEFVRRFAAHELLYFKREEPHAAVRPERVIVLDQGVRTWGSVRHALAAAALALLRIDPKRCGPVHLFATSVTGAVDLLHPNATTVAEQLEASDLGPHPGECLRRVLREGADEPRDLILLTHPRNLNEPAVASAAGERGPNDRLFAVAVDETGRAELVQWSGGGALVLRSFRADLAAAEAVRSESEIPPARQRPAALATATATWSGDVEPIPFPFRPGIVCEPLYFGFEAGSDWLVSAGRDGVLHGLAFDATPPEVLPRAYRNGAVLKQVDAVLGVTGGVVVCGRMVVSREPTVSAPAPQSVTLHAPGTPVAASGASEVVVAEGFPLEYEAGRSTPGTVEQFVAAHYDRATRHVTLHTLGPVAGTAIRWSAHPELHCVAVRSHEGKGCALDLGTFGRFPFPGPPASTLISRACLAWDQAPKHGAGPHDLSLVAPLPNWGSGLWTTEFLLSANNGALNLKQRDPNWRECTPLRDGKPFLAGVDIHRAQLAGDALALTYASAGERNLLLLHVPDGAVLGEMKHPLRNAFALSADGRWLAHCDVAHAITVAETSAPARPVVTGMHAALHSALAVDLFADPFFRLGITVGGRRHAFMLEDGALLYKSRRESPDREKAPEIIARHTPTEYDPGRFPPARMARTGCWRAVFDRLGQVLLFHGDDGPLVAAFLIRRDLAAAWIPGGVFWGDSRLIGGPATPNAGQKIGQAILDAERA